MLSMTPKENSSRTSWNPLNSGLLPFSRHGQNEESRDYYQHLETVGYRGTRMMHILYKQEEAGRAFSLLLYDHV
jgi:hypothetical protein